MHHCRLGASRARHSCTSSVRVTVPWLGSRGFSPLSPAGPLSLFLEQLSKVTAGQVHLLAVDAKLQWSGKMWDQRQAGKRLFGGSGTDMRIGIAEAERLHASICVVLTDGHTLWPPKRPKCKTIVVTTAAEGPDWAKTIKRS